MQYTAMTDADYKYPLPDKSNPRKEGWLKVSDDPAHEIHWQEYGNPEGEPAIFIHGGPGGGIMHDHLRVADPKRYRIIAFDQRGCGDSRPHVADDLANAMKDNITQATIDDMEKLRAELNLGERKAHIYGGSWGSTAAIAYAQQHPEHVESLVLRGIFLCDHEDLSYFYQGNAATFANDPTDTSLPGAYRAYTSVGQYTIPERLREPRVAAQFNEAWERYVNVIPPEERGDMIGAYHERLNNPKYSAAERTEAAMAWSHWEDVTSFLNKSPGAASDGPATAKDAESKFNDERFAIAFSTIENEYFFRSLRGQDPVLTDLLKPENIARMQGFETHVVQGAHDQVCVPASAHKFREAMFAQASDFGTYQETEAGHALTEKTTFQAVTQIMDQLHPQRKSWRDAENERPPAERSGPAQ